MKIDPYKHEERYFNWKAKLNGVIPEISKFNSKRILDYLLAIFYKPKMYFL